MNDASSIELRRLLQRCAQSFKNACIRECGVIHTVASEADKVELRNPCLAPGLKLDELDLNLLPPLLYGTGVLDDELFTAIWDSLVPLVNGHKSHTNEIHRALSRAVPALPFTTPRGGDVRFEMVQFLQVGAWLGGRMHYTNESAWLTLQGNRLGFDGQSIDWSKGHRRTRHPLAFRPREATRLPLGKGKLSTAKAGAVLRYVTKVVPTLGEIAHFVFATAVHAGREFEEILAEAFDVEILNKVEPSAAQAWQRALALLDTSASNPRDALAGLLVPLVGLGQFDTSFRVTPLFSARVRREYRAEILALQSNSIRQAKLAADPHGDGGDVAALLSLQQQLGTI